MLFCPIIIIYTPFLIAAAAATDTNDPSLGAYSLMAALVVVNTVNGHDVSLHAVVESVDMTPEECTILTPMTTSINDPLQISTNTT